MGMIWQNRGKAIEERTNGRYKVVMNEAIAMPGAYIVPRGDGLFMIGATMIESSDQSRISARSMVELLNAAYALHPSFGEAEIIETGTDVRPAFPDNLPRIRRTGKILRLNGLYRHGYLGSSGWLVIVLLGLNTDLHSTSS